MSALFRLLAVDGVARRGRLETAHGPVETPVFMPVGTQGTVKSLTPDDVREAGAELVLANTYHLMLRPGHELVRELGGLHRFMGWDRAVLTDSGGFQVFSLSKIRTLREDGVTFRSPVDGAAHFLSPERSIEVQVKLGADIIHVLDECLAHPVTHAETERSMEMTLRWAQRSKAAHVTTTDGRQKLFGIVQGGAYEDLRIRSARETVAVGFDGYAVGGMAVGEPKPVMYDLTARVTELLPRDQPRYLMGIGKPEDLVEGVARGIDMFDCVLPTRNARNGQCFTADGPLVLKQARYTRDPAPIEEGCPCYGCRRFSRAYLRHLFMARELLAYRLMTLHNLHFFMGLMGAMREAIAAARFEAFKARFFRRYAVSSEPVSLDDDGGP
ncbi:MAG: tRNA guanosine(34) transglycosylase Tgt [Candidatus Rokuibacteriota bacterium]|nr:MAG: tRNA guanosine(34) transglycosylase Tgt [Candidatus Rokubacteria bacterium]